MATVENFGTYEHSFNGPMHFAIFQKDLAKVEQLMNEGDFLCNSSEEKKSCMGDLLLTMECSQCIKTRQDFWDFLKKVLISHPSIVNMKVGGFPSLLNLNAEKLDRLKFLLSIGADPHHSEVPRIERENLNSDCNGGNALMFAVYKKADIECVKILLKLNVDVDSKREHCQTVLMIACQYANLEVVQELLTAHPDINASDDKGKTVLMYAVFNTATSSTEITNLLLLNDCDIQALDHEGKNALFYAAAKNAENVKLLLAFEIDRDVIDSNGENAIMQAALNSKAECVKVLLEAEADVNLVNKKNENILTVAVNGFEKNINFRCHCGKAEPLVLKYLIESGCDVLEHNRQYGGFESPYYRYFSQVCEYPITHLNFVRDCISESEQLSTLPCLLNAVAQSQYFTDSMTSDMYPQKIFFDHFYLFNVGWKCCETLLKMITNSPLRNVDWNLPIEPPSHLKKYFFSRDVGELGVCHLEPITEDNEIEDNEIEDNENVDNEIEDNEIEDSEIEDNEIVDIEIENNQIEDNVSQHSENDSEETKILNCNFIGLFLSSDIADLNEFNLPPYHWITYKNKFYPSIIRKRLQTLIDLGFVLDSPGCITSLTAFMLFSWESGRSIDLELFGGDVVDALFKADRAKTTKFLIKKGSNPAHRSFEFSYEPMKNFSEQLNLPDALWVAAITGKNSCVRVLLPYWTAPPLALLMFLSQDHSESPRLKELYNILKLGGPLPVGTETFDRVLSFVEIFIEDPEIREDFVQLHSKIPSLRVLSRAALRASLPPGPDLPQRLIDLVPHGLEQFVNMDLLEDDVPEEESSDECVEISKKEEEEVEEVSTKENFETFCHRYGKSAMHRAIERADFELAEKLMREGDFLCNGNGITQQNCLDLILLQIRNGKDDYWDFLERFLTAHPTLANMKLKHQSKETLLMKFCDHLERLKFLLKTGADPHFILEPTTKTEFCDCNGGNVLTYAVHKRADIECIKILLELKVDVNVKRELGQTPLMIVCKNSNFETIQQLLNADADVNASDDKGKTVLMYAVESANTEISKTILQKGCDVNAVDKEGKNALFYAPNPEIVTLLLEKDIDRNVIDSVRGQNAIMHAAFHNRAECVKVLIEAQVDIDVVDKNKENVLSLAIDGFNQMVHGNKKAQPLIIKYLIEAGCDVLEVNRKFGENNSPFCVYVSSLFEYISKYSYYTYQDEQILTYQCMLNAATQSKYYHLMTPDMNPQKIFYEMFYLCDIKERELMIDLILNSPLKNVNMVWSDGIFPNEISWCLDQKDFKFLNGWKNHCLQHLGNHVRALGNTSDHENANNEMSDDENSNNEVSDHENPNNEQSSDQENANNEMTDNENSDHENPNNEQSSDHENANNEMSDNENFSDHENSNNEQSSDHENANNEMSDSESSSNNESDTNNFEILQNFIGLFLSYRISDLEDFHHQRSLRHCAYEDERDWSDRKGFLNVLYPGTIKECLQKLMNHGFGMITPGCVSSLTSFMFYTCITKDDSDSDSDSETDSPFRSKADAKLAETNFQNDIVEISKFLIENGANPAHRTFEFVHENMKRLSDDMMLPDALWVAAMMGKNLSVRYLLPFWSGPPLSLLMFLSKKQAVLYRFKHLYKILSQGGPLPLGTQMYKTVTTFIEMYTDDETKKQFQEMHSEIPSLRVLSRIAWRASLPSGPDLPQRLSDLVPYGLKQFVNMGYIEEKKSRKRKRSVENSADTEEMMVVESAD